MSTKKPTPNNKANPQKPAGDASGKEKKRKSAGFIETSGFKPNWLETGPLTPDMLPDSPQAEDNLLTADEFEALQASLQRFYAQAVEEAPAEAEPPVVDTTPIVILAAAAPTAEVTEPPDEAPTPPLAEEAPIELPAATAEAEPEAPPAMPPPVLDQADAWVEPLLTASPEPAPALAAFVPASPATVDETGEKFVLETADESSAAVEAPAVEQAATVLATDAQTEYELEVEDYEGDSYVAEEWVAEPVAEPLPPTEEVAPARQREKIRRVRRRPDRLSTVMFLVAIILLALAAFIYYVNPFSRLALGAASLARPISSPATVAPGTASGEWCLQADFLDDSAQPPRLLDSGDAGDILASDRVFSLDYEVPAAGVYEWHVVDCADATLAYPESAAWVSTTTPNQPVTFIFDSNERADRLFFPIPFVVSAIDDAADFRVIGSFQGWAPDDASGQLERINVGLYQQVRQIARAGSYEAYVIAGDNDLAIDAYGRTTKPIPFSFQTDRNGDYVIFLVDTDRGRASVLYDMPPVLTSLAFGNGYRLLSLALAGLATLLLLGMLLRLIIMRNSRLRMEAGCPNCGQQELMRIARRPSERLLHFFGIPAYRYRCRHCTWEGTRLSESGMAVSPGVTTAPFSGH